MARARNIKPGLFKNELLGSADPMLTILFCSLWCLADKAGRLEDRPLRIKAETFPYRDNVNVDAYLADLERMGFIHRYQAGGLSLIQIAEFNKYQHPHHTEKASVLPPMQGNGAVTVKAPTYHGRTPSDSLIPDSLIPDSLIPDSTPLAPGRTKKRKTASEGLRPSPPAKVAKPRAPTPTAQVWEAYSAAYLHRYGVEPVRNAPINGKLANLVARLGNDAPAVAAYYVASNNAWYVRHVHDVGNLLRDCESLRTQWATGATVTHHKAMQQDRTATNHDAFAALIDEARAREQARP